MLAMKSALVPDDPREMRVRTNRPTYLSSYRPSPQTPNHPIPYPNPSTLYPIT